MDKEEFAQVVWDARETMYRIAKTLLRTDADCEDAVSQAVVSAFEKLHTLKKPQYAKTWLIRIVMNECYHLGKQRKREQCYGDDVISIADRVKECEPLYREEEYSELYEALCGLPDVFRMALVLYYVEQYSIKEIAQIQKVTVGTVKSRLSRGRKLLREKLQDRKVQNKRA